MKKTPTDMELLNSIYEQYYDNFAQFSKVDNDRRNRTYVPIDCALGKRHCVDFPLLASVLAGLRYENKQFKVTIWIAIVALVISSISLGVAIYKEPANDQTQLIIESIN